MQQYIRILLDATRLIVQHYQLHRLRTPRLYLEGIKVDDLEYIVELFLARYEDIKLIYVYQIVYDGVYCQACNWMYVEFFSQIFTMGDDRMRADA